jgi:hypothetical protein
LGSNGGFRLLFRTSIRFITAPPSQPRDPAGSNETVDTEITKANRYVFKLLAR